MVINTEEWEERTGLTTIYVHKKKEKMRPKPPKQKMSKQKPAKKKVKKTKAKKTTKKTNPGGQLTNREVKQHLVEGDAELAEHA